MNDSAPERFNELTPHLVVPDADEAAKWYAEALGAEQGQRIELPDGKVMSLELRFGEAIVMLASEFPDAGIVSAVTIGGTATVLQLYTDDIDRVWERAVVAGAQINHPLADTFWGERHGQLVDPFGHRWNLARRDRELSDEELARGAAEAFGFDVED